MIGISSCSIEEITLIQTIINPLADHFSSKLLVIVMVVWVFLAEENFVFSLILARVTRGISGRFFD